MYLETVTSALSGIKAAVEIVKVIRDADVSLEKAEIKLKLAELVGTLADVRMELSLIQETIIEKDRRIKELEGAFESKSKLVQHEDGYYEADATGAPSGKPYCMRCWEVDHQKRNLLNESMNVHANICPACNTKYQRRRTLPILVPPTLDQGQV
jgi:uncharacterized paraquat-inducible protein A